MISNSGPCNPHQFLTHRVLSLGKYDTEIDALTRASFHESLRAASLIGRNNNIDSLRKYSRIPIQKYIEEQVVLYPNSISQSETIIVTSKKVLDNAILHNVLSINKLPSFTMSTLWAAKSAENEQYWSDLKESQLAAVYSSLQHTEGIPARESLSGVHWDAPLERSPTRTI